MGSDGTSEPDERIASSIDRSGTYDRFVVADLSRDDRWIAIRESEAIAVRAWR